LENPNQQCHIENNFIINGYNGVWSIDHDDGSQFYNDSNNVMVSEFLSLYQFQFTQSPEPWPDPYASYVKILTFGVLTCGLGLVALYTSHPTHTTRVHTAYCTLAHCRSGAAAKII
jgi:hypothetical protein